MVLRVLEIFVTLVVPAFAIAGVGWWFARRRIMPVRWLAFGRRAVFDVLLPIYLVRTLWSVELPEPIRWDYVAAYYSATGLLYALVFAVAGRSMSPGGANMLGMAGTYANAILLGVPLITAALGEAVAVPLFLLIAIHAPLLATANSLLGEWVARDGPVASGTSIMREALGSMVRNPIIVAILLGFALNLAAGRLPVDYRDLTAPAATIIPVLALFVMGIGLADHSLRRSLPTAVAATSAKLLLHPALVAIALWPLEIDPLWMQAGVLMAALPTGINVYLFAARNGHAERETAATIALSTPASMLTLSLIMALIGVGL